MIQAPDMSVSDFVHQNKEVVGELEKGILSRLPGVLPGNYEDTVANLDLSNDSELSRMLDVMSLKDPSISNAAAVAQNMVSFSGEKEHSQLVASGHHADHNQSMGPQDELEFDNAQHRTRGM